MSKGNSIQVYKILFRHIEKNCWGVIIIIIIIRYERLTEMMKAFKMLTAQHSTAQHSNS